MQRVVLLLRAVNVGKNRIKMVDLSNALESTGLRDVRTVLASGNVIVTLPGQSGQNVEKTTTHAVEEAIVNHLGLEIKALMRTPGQLEALHPAEQTAEEASREVVTFLSRVITKQEKDMLRDYAAQYEGNIRIGEQEVYEYSTEGVHNAVLPYSRLEKLLGLTATTRNRRTIAKILDLTRVPGQDAN